MKTKIKKLLLSLVLAVVAVVAVPQLLAVEAQAATRRGTCGSDLTWILDTETGELVIDGTGAMKNYTSSSSVPWDSYSSYIQTVNIADGVTSIGKHAFYNCTSLTSITIPDSVTSIGSYAFYNCDSLTSIVIPDSVTSIGNSAFNGCKGLTSIVIPDSVTTIGDGAFSLCDSLTSILYRGSKSQWNDISKGYSLFPYGCKITYNYTGE